MSENTKMKNMNVNEVFKELVDIVFGERELRDINKLVETNGTLTKDRLEVYRGLMNQTRLAAVTGKSSAVTKGSPEAEILDMYADDNKKYHDISRQQSEREFGEIYPTTMLNNPWAKEE